jgi:hypothetical protein
MFSLFVRKKKACSTFLDMLNDSVNTATLQEFLDVAPQQSAHASACEDCRMAAPGGNIPPLVCIQRNGGHRRP